MSRIRSTLGKKGGLIETYSRSHTDLRSLGGGGGGSNTDGEGGSGAKRGGGDSSDNDSVRSLTPIKIKPHRSRHHHRRRRKEGKAGLAPPSPIPGAAGHQNLGAAGPTFGGRYN